MKMPNIFTKTKVKQEDLDKEPKKQQDIGKLNDQGEIATKDINQGIYTTRLSYQDPNLTKQYQKLLFDYAKQLLKASLDEKQLNPNDIAKIAYDMLKNIEL